MTSVPRRIRVIVLAAAAAALLADVADARRLQPARSDAAGQTTRKGLKMYPVDDTRRDPELARLRETLLEAARAQSFDLLARGLAAQVQLDFDSPVARDEALRILRTDAEQGNDVLFWRDLEDALTLGLAIDENGDAFGPYAFLAPECGQEWCAVITGTAVKVRAAPSSSAPVVDVLSYDVVPLYYPGMADDATERIGRYEYGWRPIATPSGKRGFVSEKYAYSPLARRFWFTRRGGSWKLFGIVTAGD